MHSLFDIYIHIICTYIKIYIIVHFAQFARVGSAIVNQVVPTVVGKETRHHFMVSGMGEDENYRIGVCACVCVSV